MQVRGRAGEGATSATMRNGLPPFVVTCPTTEGCQGWANADDDQGSDLALPTRPYCPCIYPNGVLHNTRYVVHEQGRCASEGCPRCAACSGWVYAQLRACMRDHAWITCFRRSTHMIMGLSVCSKGQVTALSTRSSAALCIWVCAGQRHDQRSWAILHMRRSHT